MFARTERLVLRPGWGEDAEALSAAIGHEDVLRNLARVPMPYTPDDARAFLARPHDPLAPQFLAFARTSGAPRLVGGCGILRHKDDIHELGYWVARPFWGLGFATEAARAVMSLARAIGLRQIIAVHDIDNRASAQVLRKLGFRATGRVEQRYSQSRKCEVAVAVMEDTGEVAMPDDIATELYNDRALVAA